MITLSARWELVLVLLIGAVAVGIHAFSRYQTLPEKGELRSSSFFSVPLATEVRLRLLTDRRQFFAGFLVYLAIYEFLYIVLSSSTAILEASFSIVGNAATVGALKPDFSGINVLTPVLAASVAIALSEIQPFKQIERAARRLAHSAAGIPRHLDTIVRGIERYRPSEAEATPSDLHADMRTLCWLHRLAYDEDAEALLQGNEREALRSARRAITAAFRSIDERYKEHERCVERLAAAAASTPATDRPVLEAPSDLRDELQTVAAQLKQLLALLLARHEEARREREPLGAMTEHKLGQLAMMIRNERDDELDQSILPRTLVLALSWAIALTTIYYLTRYVVHDFVWTMYSLDPSGEHLSVRAMPLRDYLLHIHNRSLANALWDAAGVGLVFVIAGFVALSTHAARADDPPPDGLDRRTVPVRNRAKGALLAMMAALPCYLSLLFVKLVVVPLLVHGGGAQYAALLNDFGDIYLPKSLFALTAVPFALAVLHVEAETLEREANARPAPARLAPLLRYALYCGLLSMVIELYTTTPQVPWRVVESALYPAALALIYLLVLRRVAERVTREKWLEAGRADGDMTADEAARATTPRPKDERPTTAGARADEVSA